MVARESRTRSSSASYSSSVSVVIWLLQLDVLVAVDRELRQHFKAALKCSGLAIFQLNVRDLRLRDRLEVCFSIAAGTGRAESLDHVLANGVGETGTNQRLGHLAGAEAGNARDLLVALDDLAKLRRPSSAGR